MSIESDIKAAVEQRPEDVLIRQLRSEIHAAIIEAHRQLAPGRRWGINELRLTDIIDHWIVTLRDRKD